MCPDCLLAHDQYQRAAFNPANELASGKKIGQIMREVPSVFKAVDPKYMTILANSHVHTRYIMTRDNKKLGNKNLNVSA